MRGGHVNRLEHAWKPIVTVEPVAAPSASGWRSKAKTWEKEVAAFMGDHPRLALGAAAAVGLLLGWMVKRK
jgi:ElaB/YqjD/DUF883 family membrane-anchored ribosome-binding protein